MPSSERIVSLPTLSPPNDLFSFLPALRVQGALTAPLERRVLLWLAARAPQWLSSDQLTLLGLAGQAGAGVGYALSSRHPSALLFVNVCIVLNWLGDSLDGTLARVRNQQRPRYGFYVDHVADVLGTTALFTGLAFSGFLHLGVAAAVLVAFLVLASESYLATYTLGRFELSQGPFGPTELRLLLMLGNLAALRSPYASLFGERWLLFDVGGAIASAAMAVLALWLAWGHAVQLRREEPIR
jgi:archaetidylinositol phosphate synthase